MNIFKKIYCRVYQGVFRLILPFLPYRRPMLLKNYGSLIALLKETGKHKVLLVTDKGIRGLGLTKTLESEIEKNNINLFVYDETVANPTTQNVEDALKIFNENGCNAIVAFGGGSPMDCAKAVGARAVRPNKTLNQMKGILKVKKSLPLLVAIPTTAGTGSETTLAAVITDAETRHKYAINDFPLIPKYTLLDAKLTVGLPQKVTATTGMDALTHAIETYIGHSTTKETRKCALQASRLIFENLLTAYNDGKNLDARQNMLQAAFLAGVAFTKSYVGYVHAVAHSLGGKYNVAHGLANAIILPVMLKKYGKSVYKKLWQMGIYCNLFDKTTTKEQGAKIFIEKIEEMNKNMNIGSCIPEIKKEDISELSKTAEKEANPLYPVPKLFTAKDLEQVYLEIACK